MIRNRFFALAALACLLVPLRFLSASFAPAEQKPIRALFLGDRGHHRPADRAQQLIPVMHDRGIEITYTEDQRDLNPLTLATYDALILYANIDNITADQDRALLDYVANGGGFVPLHCASFCFRNSPEFVALVGAQFQRHGTGEFNTKVVDADHPIMKGLEPFRTWDETYVHSQHNTKDRLVLQTRQEGATEEPWTWVRSHGKGRVFYTAYGHDGRTWGEPAFHDLVERGIRWAAHKGDVFDSHPKASAELAPFQYEKAPDRIPNYLAGQRWGVQGDVISQMQHPLEAAESLKHMVVPRGFEVKLFATEPEIAKPLCMAWDHRGRLWITESTDYPNNLKKVGQGDDRIKICEDTDGDGRADKFTIFADKLSIPTSMAFSNGGVLINDAPDTLFLKDTDGDDKADVRKVLLTGWGTRDTHAGPSNLHYGFDNWFYGIVGYSGFVGEIGGERHRFAQGFYRFKPDGSKVEFLRSTNNNSWGVSFSEEGLLFGSTANGCPSVYVPIPNRYYESVRGWSPSVLANIASSNRFYPITDKVRQVDWHGGFTAGAGHALYTARTYPKHYWNRTAFVNEPTGHLIATFLLQPNGSDFSSENSWNLVASNDEWTSPISAEVGPDGNVWVIDWYNYIVQHNPTPQGFDTGKGNAYVTSLRDKTHGRIYRVVAKDGTPSKQPKLDPKDGQGLVAALKNDNLLWRLHAQRLLVERGEKDVVPELLKLVADPAVDAIGLNPGAIHALHALHGLNAIGDAKAVEAVVGALKSPSAAVVRNALQVLPREENSTQAIVASRVLRHPDAQVRLAAFLALADMPPSKEAATAVATELLEGRVDRDRWLVDATTSAASANALAFLKAVSDASADGPTSRRLQGAESVAPMVVGRVAEHLARGGPVDSIGSLLSSLANAHPRLAESTINGLVRGWPKDKPAKLTPTEEKAMVALLPRLSESSRGPLVSLATRWGNTEFDKYAGEIASSLLATVRDEKKSDTERASAARQLIDFRRSDAKAAGELLELITPRTAPVLASGLISAVSRTESKDFGTTLVDSLSKLTPAVRSEAIRSLVGREDWVLAFMTGVGQGKVRLDDLSLDQKQALASHPNREIAQKARALLASGGGLPDADRQKVIDQLGPIVSNGGDAGKGKLVFEQQCAKCHTHSGKGGKVGPDLTGMAAHPKSELIVNILDPSRSVEGNFTAYNVAMADGRTFNGLLASETKTAIELLDTEGKSVKLLREEIEEIAASKKSIMPEGFEKQVPPASIADLLAFLTQRGKFMPLDLRKAATVVSTKGMFYDPDSTIERMVFRDWSPKTFEGVPFALIDPQGDRTPNVVMLHSPNGTTPPKMPRSVTLPCNAPAKSIHLLSGVSGWGAQGKPAGDPTVSMIVRLHYADGQTEDHPLRDGVEFADYIRRIDVPGSKFAFALRGQQIRYLAIQPKRKETIQSIDLIKGRDASAPLVMAVTVETPD
jgi:uncharacterized protein